MQALHPDAMVVKAFNTITWQRMIDPGKPAPVMPLAGNSEALFQCFAGREGLKLEPAAIPFQERVGRTVDL